MVVVVFRLMDVNLLGDCYYCWICGEFEFVLLLFFYVVLDNIPVATLVVLNIYYCII